MDELVARQSPTTTHRRRLERSAVMADTRVVVTDYIEADLDWEADEMQRRDVQFECHQCKFEPLDRLSAITKDADIVVVNMAPIDRPLVQTWERVQWVIRHGIGYDNVDVPALTEKGVVFAYQPDYCVEEVAEHAIALIMACGRKVVAGRKTLEQSSQAGQWDFSDIMPLYQMRGKTLGIIGCGRIGSRVLEKLRSFGFEFLICDPYLSDERKAGLGIETVDHETVYREADFITLHTPLTDETRRLINAETLALMKPTAYVINTARGPLLDHDAVAEALRKKRIAGAAIDVYDVEPPPPDYPLFGLDNAVLSPHLGWASEESGWNIRRKIVEDIDRFLAGQPPRNWVNRAELEAR
jgi:D-3-phosphoglycerate dehydrogenase